jgi:2-amino-4-hydroxy-6-hydroxymethyldihydropteridine diphosphokinase
MTTAYVGLGSNLGDRLGTLARAADAIEHLSETHVVKVSHVYESAAALIEDQPNFLNAVVEITTGLEPLALLGLLRDIETEFGRERGVEKGPRTLDLDLLLFGDEEIANDELTVPHPGIAQRDFVLTPLLEIAPRLVLPDGTYLKRSEGAVGAVLRDFGTMPPPDTEHNMPLGEVEWVEVARSDSLSDSIAGFDAGLQFKRDVLADQGIPYAFEPFEPGVDMDPFGLATIFKLLVPAERAPEAVALFRAVEQAPLQYPEELYTED